MSLNMEPQMHYNTFDTHKYIKALVAQGLKESQAETIVTTILESRDVDLSKLLTKEEFTEFKHFTREQFLCLQNQIDLIKKDISLLREEIKAEIASVKFDILKWIIPFLIGIIISIFAK